MSKQKRKTMRATKAQQLGRTAVKNTVKQHLNLYQSGGVKTMGVACKLQGTSAPRSSSVLSFSDVKKLCNDNDKFKKEFFEHIKTQKLKPEYKFEQLTETYFVIKYQNVYFFVLKQERKIKSPPPVYMVKIYGKYEINPYRYNPILLKLPETEDCGYSLVNTEFKNFLDLAGNIRSLDYAKKKTEKLTEFNPFFEPPGSQQDNNPLAAPNPSDKPIAKPSYSPPLPPLNVEAFKPAKRTSTAAAGTKPLAAPNPSANPIGQSQHDPEYSQSFLESLQFKPAQSTSTAAAAAGTKPLAAPNPSANPIGQSQHDSELSQSSNLGFMSARRKPTAANNKPPPPPLAKKLNLDDVYNYADYTDNGERKAMFDSIKEVHNLNKTNTIYDYFEIKEHNGKIYMFSRYEDVPLYVYMPKLYKGQYVLCAVNNPNRTINTKLSEQTAIDDDSDVQVFELSSSYQAPFNPINFKDSEVKKYIDNYHEPAPAEEQSSGMGSNSGNGRTLPQTTRNSNTVRGPNFQEQLQAQKQKLGKPEQRKQPTQEQLQSQNQQLGESEQRKQPTQEQLQAQKQKLGESEQRKQPTQEQLQAQKQKLGKPNQRKQPTQEQNTQALINQKMVTIRRAMAGHTSDPNSGENTWSDQETPVEKPNLLAVQQMNESDKQSLQSTTELPIANANSPLPVATNNSNLSASVVRNPQKQSSSNKQSGHVNTANESQTAHVATQKKTINPVHTKNESDKKSLQSTTALPVATNNSKKSAVDLNPNKSAVGHNSKKSAKKPPVPPRPQKQPSSSKQSGHVNTANESQTAHAATQKKTINPVHTKGASGRQTPPHGAAASISGHHSSPSPQRRNMVAAASQSINLSQISPDLLNPVSKHTIKKTARADTSILPEPKECNVANKECKNHIKQFKSETVLGIINQYKNGTLNILNGLRNEYLNDRIRIRNTNISNRRDFINVIYGLYNFLEKTGKNPRIIVVGHTPMKSGDIEILIYFVLNNDITNIYDIEMMPGIEDIQPSDETSYSKLDFNDCPRVSVGDYSNPENRTHFIYGSPTGDLSKIVAYYVDVETLGSINEPPKKTPTHKVASASAHRPSASTSAHRPNATVLNSVRSTSPLTQRRQNTSTVAHSAASGNLNNSDLATSRAITATIESGLQMFSSYILNHEFEFIHELNNDRPRPSGLSGKKLLEKLKKLSEFLDGTPSKPKVIIIQQNDNIYVYINYDGTIYDVENNKDLMDSDFITGIVMDYLLMSPKVNINPVLKDQRPNANIYGFTKHFIDQNGGIKDKLSKIVDYNSIIAKAPVIITRE